MNIWVFWNRTNGEYFATTHLTEEGAYLAAITDILNWYGASDDPDYFFKTLSERGTGPDGDDWTAETAPPYLEEDLKKLSSGELTEVFSEWAELTWDDWDYECEVIETRIQG